MTTSSNKKVYNLIILDESGSMESIKNATIQGFNELIQSIKHSLKADPEIDQFVNFFSFNGSGIKELMPLHHASHLTYLSHETYQPDNMTPLYDAIGIAVNKLKVSIQKEVDYNVLVTILTDGEENASKEYSYTAISALIKEQKAKGWVFTYIGANHDVEKTAMSLNINNHLYFQTNKKDTKDMFNKVRSSRENYMKKMKSGSTELNEDFFKEEKKDS